MERPILDIPGYFYDQERRKYFKVQSSGSAPAASAYTANDVKRRRILDERATTERLEEARQKRRVRRSKLLRLDFLTGRLLTRALGQPNPTDFAQILSGCLVNSGSIIIADRHLVNPVFAVQHRPDLGPSIIHVTAARSGMLCDLRVDTDSTVPKSQDIASGPTCLKQCHWRYEHVDQTFDPSSVSVNRESQRLAITWLTATSGAGILIRPLLDEYQWPSQVFGPGITRGPRVDIFSSTAAAAHSSLLFAFGSSHGVLTLDKQASDLKWITPTNKDDKYCPRDVFALEFQFNNPSILVSGGRSGKLHNLDLRIPCKFGPIPDIYHGASVTHIKQVDTHRILVAGLNSILCQYDLRYLKQNPRPRGPLSRRKVTAQGTWPTEPVLEYPNYRNPWNLRVGFDVDLETGIIAAAQEQEGGVRPPVQLFSLHGGKTIRAPQITGEAMLKLKDPEESIRWIRFERDRDHGMKSLYIGSRGITRFAWTTKDDDDSP